MLSIDFYYTIPQESLLRERVLKEIFEKTETRAGGIILSAKGSAMMASQRLNALSRGQY